MTAADHLIVRQALLQFDDASPPVIDVREEFEIPSGVSLLVAPSGSGKTTLLRLLSGWFGGAQQAQVRHSLSTNYDVLRDVEFVGNHQTLLPWYSLRANIRLRGGDPSAAEADCRTIGLLPAALDRYPYELSLGMYKRAELVAALAHSPRLLLLDELFSSLDPEARRSTLALVQASSSTQQSVLITTHTPEAFPEVLKRTSFRLSEDERVVGIRSLP